MDIQIHSADSARRLFDNPVGEKTALISIENFGAEHPILSSEPKFRLNLFFDDLYPYDIDYENCGKYAFRLFTAEHADNIAAFVYQTKDHVNTLICQCRFGRSRSAAVAAAVKEHFSGNGMEIFADGKYSPNEYVYHLTLSALNRLRERHEGK